MDTTLEARLPQSDDEKFLSSTYEERWSHLQPVIVRLYTRKRNRDGRTATLDKLVEFMRNHYRFYAAYVSFYASHSNKVFFGIKSQCCHVSTNVFYILWSHLRDVTICNAFCSLHIQLTLLDVSPTEYRRRFRDWGISKRMVQQDKDAITTAIARRKRPGASLSDATTQQNGEYGPLDYKKLKRHLKSRKPSLQIAPGLLSSWNLPYAAFLSSLPKNPDQPSPFGPLGLTPEHFHIQSPEALTPGRAAAGPSPRIELVYEKQKEYCTSLFLQGRLDQLLVSLGKQDRSFVLAKSWGRDLLNPSQTQTFELPPQSYNAFSPFTPSALLNLSSGPSSPDFSVTTNISIPPTQLCKWSIHVSARRYYSVDEMGATTPSNLQPNPTSFVNFLHQSMAANDFTTTPKTDLPLAQHMITRSSEGDPSPLQLDAWKLAIMAGNLELLNQLFEDNFKAPEGIEDLYLFHLAVAFLDGGNQCCGVLTELSQMLPPSFSFYHNIDNHGHTILDALVVTVLRSHTSVQPGDVSYGFHSPNRFPGEEKDICGRWDVDAPAVRELFKQGYARIPTRWKHPFCHTAVQAVCHSMIAIFASPASPSIDTQSGLFVRRCTACGLELKLRPLHTLVVSAFYLAQLGMPGETLFGAIAMMVCLIALGADVSIKANISVEEILSSADAGQCRHTPLSPLDLIKAVPKGVIAAWSENCRVGWGCLIAVLELAVMEHDQALSGRSHRLPSPTRDERSDSISSTSNESSEDDLDECYFQEEIHDDWLKLPCTGARMGLLWASIQAEFLTYRRVVEEESWISNNFSMEALKRWLEEEDTEFSIPLVQNRMFESHTRCGWFHGYGDFLCPTAEDVCTDYFMNMDIYNRATYIEQPYLSGRFETVEEVKDSKV
ncbi:hypothetical protein FSPOR_5632 [Fusarium sporotrichioides]|uniref:Uncharacterized protein n=1 Tax=Fusarium sporotrichioides TaxID=5514 RepID=A0A395S6G4_FUSSP|nr:hypothetical protein FSPOR_5632 [Fusarium sporotrichioides]